MKECEINEARKIIHMFIICIIVNITFTIELFILNANKRTGFHEILICAVSCIIILLLTFIFKVESLILKRFKTIFSVAMILYCVGGVHLIGPAVSKIAYIVGIVLNLICSAVLLSLCISQRSRRNDDKDNSSISNNNIELRIRHSFASSFIILYILGEVMGGFLFIFFFGFSLNEVIYHKSVFILISGMFIGLFIANMFWKNSIITITNNKIDASYNLFGQYIEEQWNDVEKVRIFNVFIMQIICLYIKNSKRKALITYFAFTPDEIRMAILDVHPELL